MAENKQISSTIMKTKYKISVNVQIYRDCNLQRKCRHFTELTNFLEVLVCNWINCSSTYRCSAIPTELTRQLEAAHFSHQNNNHMKTVLLSPKKPQSLTKTLSSLRSLCTIDKPWMNSRASKICLLHWRVLANAFFVFQGWHVSFLKM